jgi:hypothetical protein
VIRHHTGTVFWDRTNGPVPYIGVQRSPEARLYREDGFWELVLGWFYVGVIK